MKYIFNAVIAFFLIFSISCASKQSRLDSSEKAGDNSEIGTWKTEGGETLIVRGYSEDSELNKKIKAVDLEIIDCYKQFYEIANPQEMTITFSLVIDEMGDIESLKFRENSSKIANRVAECIKKDVELLAFRPGDVRDARMRLTFKLAKRKNERVATNEARSKMVASLAKMKKFRVCYDNQDVKIRGDGGKFLIRFTITKAGNVADMKLIYDSFKNRSVARCVLQKMEETVFPESENEDEVDVIFNFTNSSDSLPDKKRKSMDIEFD